MAIIDSKNKAFIPQKMKAMLLPLALLLAMIALSVIVFKVGVARISVQRADFRKAVKHSKVIFCHMQMRRL